MTAAQQIIAANRADLASRIASAFLHRMSVEGIPSDSAAMIHRWDHMHDADWLLLWRAARASRCPSAETKAVVRHLLLARMPRCLACGLEPATREAGKSGRPGGHLCERDWRAEQEGGE